MPRLEESEFTKGEWSTSENKIYLPPPSETRYMTVAHEIAHWKLGHGQAGSLLSDVIEERDAWIEALRHMDPEDIDVDIVNSAIGSYTKSVRDMYGDDSPQYGEAKRVRRELMALVRLRKKYG